MRRNYLNRILVSACGMLLLAVAPASLVSATEHPKNNQARQVILPLRAGLDANRTQYLSGGSDPGLAARWSSCKPIKWTVDSTNIAASGVRTGSEITRWQQAVTSIGAVSRYRFEHVPVDAGAAAHQPQGAPSVTGIDIVITYESATDTARYQMPSETEPGGIAESTINWLDTGDAQIATSSSIVMDYAHLLRTIRKGTYRAADRRALMTHELGHALGLGHSPDPADMKFPEWIAGKTQITSTDAGSLTSLAQQPCEL